MCNFVSFSFKCVFDCFDSLVIQFWIAVNAMVRLRPPCEGERLCTPWFWLCDLEFLGIVAFENFWAKDPTLHAGVEALLVLVGSYVLTILYSCSVRWRVDDDAM